jgi:pimeloyl-ACP methyl ester carboxylesterase
MVPGSLHVAQDWQLLADLLAPQVITYAVDRRGHGASGDNPAFSIEREQQDIAAVLRLAGPEAVLLGHSYGGLVTLGVALRQPPAGFILYEPRCRCTGPSVATPSPPSNRPCATATWTMPWHSGSAPS